MRLASALAFTRAGSSNAARMARMAMTNNNSINVNARRRTGPAGRLEGGVHIGGVPSGARASQPFLRNRESRCVHLRFMEINSNNQNRCTTPICRPWLIARAEAFPGDLRLDFE